MRQKLKPEGKHPPSRSLDNSPHWMLDVDPDRPPFVSHLEHGNLRSAVEPDRHREPSNTGINVKRSGRRVEQAQNILAHTKRHDHRPIEWDANLSTVRMAGQHQVISLLACLSDPDRVMHEQDVPGSGVGPDRWLVRTEASGSNNTELSVFGHSLLVEQPRSARPCETLGNVLERRLAPVVMIPRHAIQR